MLRFPALALCALTAGCLGVSSKHRHEVRDSVAAVRELEHWLGTPRDLRTSITDAAFAFVPLTRDDAEHAARQLWDDHAAFIRATRAAEIEAQVIELDGLRMRFETVYFGDTNRIPPGGRSLFLSLHGGGNARPAVNDSQWRNQIRLGRDYAPTEGIYLAPRAPTDTWNLWHEAHIDRFFGRFIENLVVLEQVNPDRVYLMGYSAGGDGVYQVAPRMADRLAAAAMMAGHPNEASPLGLRNLPFAIQVGALDAAYKRNEVAAEWGRKLDELQVSDPAGYTHFTKLHDGKRHWMELADRQAIPWMEQFKRNPLPARIVWRQDDVTHDRFYWLGLPPGTSRAGQEIIAERNGTAITVRATSVTNLHVRFNDAMTDLDQPVTIRSGNQALFSGRVARKIAVLEQTLRERGDPRLVFSGEVAVKLP